MHGNMGFCENEMRLKIIAISDVVLLTAWNIG